MSTARPRPGPERATFGRLLTALLLLAALPAMVYPGRPGPNVTVGDLIYGWQRELRQRSLVATFDGLARVGSDHFVVHFDPRWDSDWAHLVLECAEGARDAALRRLGWSPLESPGAKVPILLYADYSSLDEQFGSRPGFRALGAYWCGVIQVLSPRLWLSERPPVDARRQLWTRGPIIHEYTHYLLDKLIPRGNYPRWLSEGLAQYVEYREAGYLWLEASNTISTPIRDSGLYSIAELGGGFDSLPNTALAYREAFLLVTYLVDSQGPDTFSHVLKGLASGLSFEVSLLRATGLSLAQLEDLWLDWLDHNLERYSLLAGEEATRA